MAPSRFLLCTHPVRSPRGEEEVHRHAELVHGLVDATSAELLAVKAVAEALDEEGLDVRFGDERGFRVALYGAVSAREVGGRLVAVLAGEVGLQVVQGVSVGMLEVKSRLG